MTPQQEAMLRAMAQKELGTQSPMGGAPPPPPPAPMRATVELPPMGDVEPRTSQPGESSDTGSALMSPEHHAAYGAIFGHAPEAQDSELGGISKKNPYGEDYSALGGITQRNPYDPEPTKAAAEKPEENKQASKFGEAITNMGKSLMATNLGNYTPQLTPLSLPARSYAMSDERTKKDIRGAEPELREMLARLSRNGWVR